MTYYILHRVNTKTGEGTTLWQGTNWRMVNDRKKWLNKSLQQLKLIEQYYIALEITSVNN